ncbi:palmitoyltransferase PFA3 [Trypanosoma rangeli]|uniref:Palmitoyltransferase n=1 Tax=Trypanosoma rangeli TaxID=5698 RepID=A0A3R7KZF6_TRYRA|nr:palmitoyltransferase PFA3 [Trypanosoma rangeli]RNF04480.1 palmitoyltransferase PFA3 [Trypanosoma rangeli]|eukprot:RNF04480.1 palmitoyltransferase PFA3 [Trypanosoma rangeli]
MRFSGHSCADVVIIITLFLVTSYSLRSYCVFLFPRALYALGLAFLQPFRKGVARPISSSPLHLQHLLNVSTKDWILLGISVFLFALTLWAYLAAAVTDAGRVPQAFGQHAPRSASLALRVCGALNICPVCAAYKPQRAHHCSRCRHCVLKYDHHCPWLGRCVGFFNYKLYLLVVFYTFVFTLWVATLLLLAMSLYIVEHYQTVGSRIVHRDFGTLSSWPDEICWTGPLMVGGKDHTKMHPGLRTASTSSISLRNSFAVCPPFLGVYVCLVEAIMFLILTGSLLRKHCWLARHNLTTLDLVIYQHKLEEGICTGGPLSVFDIGVKGCLHQVFGDGDELGEHVHRNFIVRWFFRLLPFPAYPKQAELYSNSSLGTDAAGNLGAGTPFAAISRTTFSVPSYGTLKEASPACNTIARNSSSVATAIGCRGEYRNVPVQFSGHTRSLLGLSFSHSVISCRG